MTLILLLIIWLLLIINFNNRETFNDDCSPDKDDCSPDCLNLSLRVGCSKSKCNKCEYCQAYLEHLNFKCSTNCRNMSLSEGCPKKQCSQCKYCEDYLKQISPICKNVSMDTEYKKHIFNGSNKKLNREELIKCLIEWQKLIHVNEILYK